LPSCASGAAARDLSWSALPATGIWPFDGRRWDALSSQVQGTRGSIVHLSGVPEPLAEACRRLVNAPGVEAVRAVAFFIE
jgi:hypothetical protein